MTLNEKKESLIKEEWENFHAVNNEGGKASCQNDPETFYIMRRSQFCCWDEELVESWHNDLVKAREKGRNLLSEKYAWMMQQTAPFDFDRISHLLTFPTIAAQQLMEDIIAIEVKWMEEYEKNYPFMAMGNRPIHSGSDSEYETSFETYLRGELHTYSENTLKLYHKMVNSLYSKGESMSIKIMDAMVKAYGYRDLDHAEAQQRALAEK